MVTKTPTPSAPLDEGTESSLSVVRINGAVVVSPQGAHSTPLNAEPLTDRELQVLSLVAEGCANKVIAVRLTICERTVKNHLTCIMTKLRASDRTHAVVTAIRLGWLSV